jgi:electron transfer flavoprotein alpha subunit
VTTLVFLEHHGDAIQRDALGVLGKAAGLGDGDVAGVLVGSGVDTAAAEAGRHGAARVFVADDESLAAPLPQPRVDALAALVREHGFENVLFPQSVLSADVAAGLAARLDAGLNWDLVDLELRGGELVAQDVSTNGTGLRPGGSMNDDDRVSMAREETRVLADADVVELYGGVLVGRSRMWASGGNADPHSVMAEAPTISMRQFNR